MTAAAPLGDPAVLYAGPKVFHAPPWLVELNTCVGAPPRMIVANTASDALPGSGCTATTTRSAVAALPVASVGCAGVVRWGFLSRAL